MQRILLVLLMLPLATWLLLPGDDSLSLENRLRSPVPKLPTTLDEARAFPAAAEAFIADNIGLRDQLIAAKIEIDSVVNGRNSARVIAGKDGWLFYNAASVIERNTGREFNQYRIDNLIQFVKEAQQLSTDAGAKFVAITVPNSHSVYRDKLPNWAQVVKTPMTEQRAYTAQIADAGIPLSDPYALFQSYDLAATPLYFKRDTHWNNFGAYIAFHDALGKLGLAAQVPAPRQILQGYADGKYYGVLDQFLGLTEALEAEPLPRLDMSAFQQFPERNFTEADNHVSMDSYQVEYRPDGPRLLVIGDSFSYSFFRQYWGAVFGTVYWSHHDYGRYDRTIFERFKPDYVIMEFVDWEVPAWVPFDARPTLQ